jgi:glycosyltransferase involved in cell wall biosynthesis
MRIVIDLQGAQTGSRFRGIGRYSLALAQAMAREAGDHQVWICLNDLLPESIEPVREAFADVLPESRIVSFAAPGLTHWDVGDPWRRGAAERMREAFLAGLQPDIVHVSSLFEGAQEDAVASIGRNGTWLPTAVTLYDLIPLRNPKDYLGADWTRAWYGDRVDSLRRADLLLAISAHAREEAIEFLGLPPERIVNMSSAASPMFRPVRQDEAERADLTRRFGARPGYVMYSCAFESRKNVDRLIQAFGRLPEAVRGHRQLLVAGRVGDAERKRLQALAVDCGIGDRLVLPGYVEDEDLVRLYSGCALYVFPSLHEGFGLPALEAMACGAPTIGSGTTSVPEVIGREDALFDPADVDAIARTMQRVLVDETFAASLREHAPRQAARFSWEATARCAIAAFESVHVRHRAEGRRVRNPFLSPDRGAQGLIDALATMDTGTPPSASDLLQASEAIDRNCKRLAAIDRGSALPERLGWRIEGPFDSSYSLALVNREAAGALALRGHDVALHSTEGGGDFPPDPAFLARHPELGAMHARAKDMPDVAADVASRNLYPPRVADMHAGVNLMHCYAWEESGFPPEWVDAFNWNLDGIACVSRHVEKVLVDNGVGVALSVCGNGVDHWDRIAADPSVPMPGKAFRFLHVSSCFPRKGADALLQAYGRAFRASDDVTLVIKTFANPHNRIHDWLADARSANPDYPDVAIIEDDLDEARLKGLYERSHALVAPSRAEGYGLPLAEAMLSGLPVIATAWSGQRDFCNDDTAWLVDYRFAPAESHFDLFGSVWADPDIDDLARAMREVFDASPEARAERPRRGRAQLLASHKWSDVAERLETNARSLSVRAGEHPPRIGLVSSWNTRCGIATYSAHLFAQMDVAPIVFAVHDEERVAADDANVVRCWQGEAPSLDELSARIDEAGIDVLVVQFQYAFYDFGILDRFLQRHKAAGRTVVVMLHATIDPPAPHKRLAMLADGLRACDRVLVHGIGDLNRLKALGIVDNVALFPHGVLDVVAPGAPASDAPFTVASYGFFLPHKGLPELVGAIALLARDGQDVRLKMVNAEFPNPVSRKQIELVRARIAELGIGDRIEMITQFLPDAESLAALADAHLVVFPYQATGESASGAVRYGLASGKPVAVTPIPIFDDVRRATFTLPGTSAEEIAAGIAVFAAQARAPDEAFRKTMDNAARWRDAHRYSRVGARLERILMQLHRRRPLHAGTMEQQGIQGP